MGLRNCKECNQQISTNASTCPHCGAPQKKKTSVVTYGCLILIVIIFIPALFVNLFKSESKTVPTPKSLGGTKSPQHTSPQIDPDADRKHAEVLAKQMGLVWRYSVSNDEMGRGEIKFAEVSSTNTVNFSFPYQGEQRASLMLRKHPKYGNDIILRLEKAQFLCDSLDGCSVAVRFGENKPQTFTAMPSNSQSTNVIFIQNFARFLTNLKKSDKVSIEAQFYQEGSTVFHFQTAGLQW